LLEHRGSGGFYRIKEEFNWAMKQTFRDTTLNALAIEAFNDLLKKYGKRQSVENPLLD
jgi:hypothetical protein